MIGDRGNIAGRVWHKVIGMEEIGLTRRNQAGGARLDIVPAHMRHFDRRIGHFDPAHFAADPVEPCGHAEFDPARGQQLHADANPQKRHAADLNTLCHRLDQAGDSTQCLDTGTKRADAGQHDAIGGAHHVRIGGDHYTLATRHPQGIGDRPQVARAIIDQRGDLSHPTDPWWTARHRPCAGRSPLPGAWPGQTPCRYPRSHGGCCCHKDKRCAA